MKQYSITYKYGFHQTVCESDSKFRSLFNIQLDSDDDDDDWMIDEDSKY